MTASPLKFPKITVVTPSYNQGQFLEETILSVLNQDYPNLEYIIIDGGSSDRSVEIIRKYEDKLAYWISEPDGGQSDAINKGFLKATGEILCWLNSDDILNKNALNVVAKLFQRYPKVGFIFGDRHKIDSQSRILSSISYYVYFYKQLRFRNPIAQESAFWRRDVFIKAGPIDTSLKFCMDYDLWCRIARITQAKYVPYYFGSFRQHKDSKTANLRTTWAAEKKLVRMRYFGKEPGRLSSICFNAFWSFLRKVYRITGMNKVRRIIYGINSHG